MHKFFVGASLNRGGVLEDVFGLDGQVLKICLVLGIRTALFFKLLKFCRSPKNFFEDLVFGKHLRLCPWPQEGVSLA